MALGEVDVLLLAAAMAVYSICDAKRDWHLGTWFSGGLGSVRFMCIRQRATSECKT